MHESRQKRIGYQWLVALLIPLFLSACGSTPRSIRWVDPDFARGHIPVSHIELLPLSVAFHIDGVGASHWKTLQKHNKQLAVQLEKAIRTSFTRKQYKMFRGWMSRDRLFDLLGQASNAAQVGSRLRSANKQVGVDPVLVAGGIPGTDAVLVVEGLANLTTGGKKAAQGVVITLMVVVVVVIIAALIAYAVSAKGSKGSKSSRSSRSTKLRRAGRRGRVSRFSRRRSGKRSYRRRYFRRRGARRSVTRGYYKGSYRHRDGRTRRYRVLRYRRNVAPGFFLYYMPHLAANAAANAAAASAARPPHHKQPFFSGSYLDLSVSMVEKGSGLLLWHNFRRWKIDPSSPTQIQALVRKLASQLPTARNASPRP